MRKARAGRALADSTLDHGQRAIRAPGASAQDRRSRQLRHHRSGVLRRDDDFDAPTRAAIGSPREDPWSEPARSLAGESLSEVEKRLILDALAKAKGNKSKAAKVLGITRSQLYTRMKRFGIDTPP